MIFILGIERSATTWISNLLESHPGTNVYVEPMSELTARFKEWPDRFVPIENTEEKAKYFKSEFEIIKNHKRWLLTTVFSHRYAWTFDLWLSNYLVRKQVATEAAKDFSEINFHRKAQPAVSKRGDRQVDVIKELRLNFNPHVIPLIDPDARIIVVIRNVFATIQSIQHHLARGNLAELHRALQKQYGNVHEQTIFRYWRDSYNSLFEHLDNMKMPHYTLHQTRFMMNPEEEATRMCNFVDLPDPESILLYLKKSNREGEGIHNTNRDHTLLLKQNEEAREAIQPVIKDELDESEFHPNVWKAIENG